MGKGDKRSKRGKINVSSYGKSRPKKKNRPAAAKKKSATAPKAKKTTKK